MPLTQNAEHKRRSRARKPSAWHDRERESSRQRMALGRARNKAQKRASLLRSLLDEGAKQTFQARADKERQRLICDWFRRKKLKLTPKEINDDEIINNSMPKPDLCKIEIQVAEFEISMMTTGAGDDNVDGENFASEQEKVKAINRKRMAIHRAMKKAQKRASQLRGRLDKWDKQVLETRADKEKQRLICDWFRRKGWRMDLESINDDVVKNLMPKFDFQKIETQVAEFEISIMGVGGDHDERKILAPGLDKNEGKSIPKALYKIDYAEQHLSNQIGRFSEKEMTTSEKRTVLETNSVPETTGTPSRTLPEEMCKVESSEQHLNNQTGRFSGKETKTSEKRKILETTSVPETGMLSTAARDSGEDAFETAAIMPITYAEKKRRSRDDDAERKRRSRAKKSSAWHDRERESSRQRMALGRARKTAQQRASQLRSLLDEADKQVFEARAEKEKQHLICDWFRHKGLIMDPGSINDNVVNNFVPKLDLQKIELQVAEFEIALMGGGGDNVEAKNLASAPDKEKEMATSEKLTVPETTSIREPTGTPPIAAGDFGKDAAAASLLLLGLRGAKGDETTAIGVASVREAPAAVGDSDEGASRPDPVGATGITDNGTAARLAATPSLDAGTAPVAFPPSEGWRSAIDQGSGRVNYYRRLPERRAPSALGDAALPPGGGSRTGRVIGVCGANHASIPDSVMSSDA